MNQKKIIYIFLIVLSHFSCSNAPEHAIKNEANDTNVHINQLEFFKNLSQYCGSAFEGKIINGSPTDTAFNGKTLVMHIRSCDETTIKIPFFVGEDKSRTWVITKTSKGLELKHDHRHEDGTSDVITMYGGHSTNGGSVSRQLFPADQETADILPLAIGNIWWIDFVQDSVFSYNSVLNLT